MLKPTKQDGATNDGHFQAGDPFKGIPPTRVSADWLNSVQDEICNVITSRGITLDRNDTAQLSKALIDIYNYGDAPKSYSIANNQASAINLGIDPFDKTVDKAVFFSALSVRHTKTTDQTFVTNHGAIFNSFTGKWTLLTDYSPALTSTEIKDPAHPEVKKYQLDAGSHLLTITPDGKVQYQTSNMPGDEYQGTMTIFHFRRVRNI